MDHFILAAFWYHSMPTSTHLTVTEHRKIWTDLFLPSVWRKIKGENEVVNSVIKTFTDHCVAIEKSQAFISAKYDKVLQALQSTNKKSTELEVNNKKQDDGIEKLEEVSYEMACTINETQQYIRRDCLEITGIPKQLIKIRVTHWSTAGWWLHFSSTSIARYKES